MSTLTRVQRRRIGEVLVNEGLVSRENMDEALKIQAKTNETLSSILIDMGCVSDQDVAKTMCQQYQLPYVRLANYDVDNKLVELFPVEFLHLNKILPFDRIGEMLLCAVTEVPKAEVLAEIPRITKQNAALYAGSLSEVEHYLQQLCPLAEGMELPRPRPKPAEAEAKGTQTAKEAKQLGKIFNEDTNEALLEALDTTWDSIFDGMDGSESAES